MVVPAQHPKSNAAFTKERVQRVLGSGLVTGLKKEHTVRRLILEKAVLRDPFPSLLKGGLRVTDPSP